MLDPACRRKTEPTFVLHCSYQHRSRQKVAVESNFLAAFPFACGALTMGGAMSRHDEPRAAVTEADVVAHLSRSRKPQSLREIAAALGLRHSARRALVKLAR